MGDSHDVGAVRVRDLNIARIAEEEDEEDDAVRLRKEIGRGRVVENDSLELLEIELKRLQNALDHLTRSSGEIKEALRESGFADKTYEEALKENAIAAVNIQGQIYQLAVEVARRNGTVGVEYASEKKEEEEEPSGTWV